jgi:hypothetical protein
MSDFIDWDNDFSIAKLLGDPLVEDFNQHVLLGIIGKTGSGKSSGGLRLAYDTSRYLAYKKGGAPEDYFTLDNVAIITPDEIIRVMKTVKKFQIYVFDDIGVGWNSRDWNSKVNKIMNNIAMTFRTKRNILILTVPDDEMIDKVPRHLMHYRVDMEQANFQNGYTVGKFQRMIRSYKFKKNMFPYVKNDGKKYIRCIFTRPPAHIADAYEMRRELIQAKMEEDNLRELEDMFTESDPNDKPLTKQQTQKQESINLTIDALEYIKTNPGMTAKQACKQAGCNPSTFNRYKDEVNCDGVVV